MTSWDTRTELSAEFLAQCQEYRLYDTLHQIQAFILYPMNCKCEANCECDKLRASIRLSLNMDLYNKARARQDSVEVLNALRFALKIPDAQFFMDNHSEAYPVWLVKERLREKAANNHFKIVGRLVWTLLRLAKTYEVSIFKQPRASLNEAIEIIVGKNPLKSKTYTDQEPYLCGEKGYSAHFATYKSVCHFIAALEKMGKDGPFFTDPGQTDPGQIEEFLSLSHWIRQKLLSIQTLNVKGTILLAPEALVSLPSWVNSESVCVTLDLLKDKHRELQAMKKVVFLEDLGIEVLSLKTRT